MSSRLTFSTAVLGIVLNGCPFAMNNDYFVTGTADAGPSAADQPDASPPTAQPPSTQPPPVTPEASTPPPVGTTPDAAVLPPVLPDAGSICGWCETACSQCDDDDDECKMPRKVCREAKCTVGCGQD
jgi:hypothetical protein